MKGASITLEVVRRYIGQEGLQKPALPGSPPNYVTVSEKRARDLLESGVCRVPPAKAPPAQEAGAEKKSSGAPTAGRSTDLPSSSAPGPETLFSSLVAALPLPGRKSTGRRRGKTAKGVESE